MSLSTTEPEYVAVSKVFKEIKFVTNLLEVMEIEYEKPIRGNIDNVGPFFYKKRNTRERTRQISRILFGEID